MTDDRLRDVLRILREALERDGSERAAFLDAACGADADLRREVEALLAESAGGSHSLLDTPPWAAPTFEAGQRLGPYEVVGLLGTGGMGVVYKARDTRLKRTVALKVLSGASALDPAARDRFTREALAIAALNHPHICAVFDTGREGTVDYLVMEHLEGKTLAKRLEQARGRAEALPRPLPLAEALAIGVQIADALAAAQRQGIVHRDLKPANVMLVKLGGAEQVKLLDFGLAKLMRRSGPGGAAETPTSVLQSGTTPGTVMGTVPYMAPEQLEGKDVDARADIFSFGCVLYEMLTGRRAFAGDTGASVISAIMTSEPPPISELQPVTPQALDRLVHKCLVKDPDGRWQSAQDLADDLRWIAEVGVTDASTRPAGRRRGARRLMAPGAILVGMALLVVLTVVVMQRLAPPAPVVSRMELRIGAVGELGGRNQIARLSRVARSAGGGRTAFALSPDGRRLVFVARKGDAQQLYARALDEEVAHPLEGTKDAEQPFFSPDGRWIAFWAQDQIRKVPAQGGPATAICDAPGRAPFGASWGDDGTIVFAPSTNAEIWRVREVGGKAEPATVVGPSEQGHRMPQVLPGGALLFTVKRGSSSAGTDIHVQAAGSTSHRPVLGAAADARFVGSGHLVFMRLGTLWAVPFDVRRLTATGAAAAVVGDVAQALNSPHTALESGAGQFSVSRSGTLAYLPGGVPPEQLYRYISVDRHGVVTSLPIEPRSFGVFARLSPDGSRLATTVRETTRRDVWICDIARGTASRLSVEGEASQRAWSPDGRFLAFSGGIGGLYAVWRIPSDGSGPPELLVQPSAQPRSVSSWSRDWATLAYVEQAAGAAGANQNDIGTLGLTTAAYQSTPFVRTGFADDHPEFSPDSRWIAYQSNETGRAEVYLRRYGGSGQRVQVTSAGGSDPAWSPRWKPGGGEVFYLAPDETGTRWMTVVTIATEPAVVIGKPKPLFSTKPVPMDGDPLRQYDVTTNAQRFIVRRAEPTPPTAPVTHVSIILNWFEELKAKVPTKK